MKTDTAIEILAALKESASGREAEALALAVGALEEARERREREVARAIDALRVLLGDAEGAGRERTWRFLRGHLNLPPDVLDEVEARLGLASKEEAR